MTVSLNNKRNTKIVETFAQHPTRIGKFCVARSLVHHGATTCTIATQVDGRVQVTIDLCGFDTVTTRGKINLFLKRYLSRVASLQRVQGVTLLTHYAQGTGTVIRMYDNRQAFISY